MDMFKILVNAELTHTDHTLPATDAAWFIEIRDPASTLRHLFAWGATAQQACGNLATMVWVALPDALPPDHNTDEISHLEVITSSRSITFSVAQLVENAHHEVWS